MTFKDQIKKVKDNWLIILILAVLLVFSSVGNVFNSMQSVSQKSMALYDSVESSRAGGIYYPQQGSDFAPDVEERKITKTSSLSTEVKRGQFYDTDSRLKSIISSTDSILLNENINNYGSGLKEYKQGSYTIKIDSTKYDSVISQLKELGEVKSFSENQLDITGSYTNTQLNIDLETKRLERFQKLYIETKDISDKIELEDKIFDLERRISYMQDSLKNMDQRIDYSTVHLTISEKRSEYADIILVKISDLIKNFVDSFNSLIRLLFWAIPWIIAYILIKLIYNKVKKKR